jgi:xanthine dehydrogenase accessory factor
VNRWIDDLHDALRDDESAAIVTVAGVRGSAPRETGAKMIVTGKEAIGSVGGGQLEYQCTRIAVEQIRKTGAYRERRFQRRFPLGTNCGQCCGGVVDIMFERVTSSDKEWLEELKRLHDDRRPLVLVTPLEHGSGKYLVTGERCMNFDTQLACADEVIAAARQLIAGNGCAQLLDDFLLEPVLQSEFRVAIFGAGHVGAATVDALARLDCDIRWIDSRRNIFPARLPDNVTAVESAIPAQEVAAMPPGTYYLILTHSHPLDFEICDQVLRRGDFGYCGLIGSISKRRRFERDMRKQSMPDAMLEELVCPIGVAGIDGKKPAEIAIAIAAEILRVRDAAAATNRENDAVPDNLHVL